MGSFSSMEISASGLSAQRRRLDIIANNIANASTTRTADGGPYRRQQVLFSAHMEEVSTGVSRPAGVDLPDTVMDPSPPRSVYDPGHPDADPRGYVMMPNVNPVREMVDMIAATRAYEANVTAMSAAKSMAMKALDIGKG